MMPSSALFVGEVVHMRMKPRRHKLRYSAYWLLLDLEEIDRLHGSLRFFSRNRLNLFSFCDRDHCVDARTELRDEIIGAARDAGIPLSGARILVLTMPRVLGYVFNPLTTYFLYGAHDRIEAILYEVHNTFAECHRYVLAAGDGEGALVQQCRKQFYVSPFMDMEVGYTFRVRPPGERVAIAIRAFDADGHVLTAAMSGERRQLTDRGLLQLFVSIPLLTLKVIIGIHWEALRLWLKGVRIRSRRSAPGATRADLPGSTGSGGR